MNERVGEISTAVVTTAPPISAIRPGGERDDNQDEDSLVPTKLRYVDPTHPSGMLVRSYAPTRLSPQFSTIETR
jgi:hypothetical protein